MRSITPGLKQSHESLVCGFLCRTDHKEDEPLTDRDAGEDDVWASPLRSTVLLQIGVRGCGAASLLSQRERSRWPPCGVEGLSGLLGVLRAGHCTEYDHRSDQFQSGQHLVRHHPHPCADHDRIRLSLPLHSKYIYIYIIIFDLVKENAVLKDWKKGVKTRFCW